MTGLVGRLACTLRPLRAPVLFILVLGTIDVLGAHFSGITIGGLMALARPAAVSLAMGLTWLIAGSLGFGGRASDLLARLGFGTTMFAIGGIAAGAAVVFSYICARPAFPFVDPILLRLDHMLGFDWQAWNTAIARRPEVKTVLDRVYASYIVQSAALYFITAFGRDRRRPVELFLIINVGAVVCSAWSIVVPALGAAPSFGGHADWVPDLLALRQHGPVQFLFSRLRGVVQLPSFHAALGLFFIWASRNRGPFTWFVAALNSVMIVSALSSGGHYLADVIAGLAVAAAVIAVVHRAVYGGAPVAGDSGTLPSYFTLPQQR